VCAEE